MGSPQPDLTALLAALTSELDRCGLRFMLIGGQAVLPHGWEGMPAALNSRQVGGGQ